ncbi:MAG: hypothetical protein ACOY45_16520 [Pseudomonadota bacterium]
MRAKTLAGLLVLCGSTAAFAQISSAPPGQDMANTVSDNASTDLANNMTIEEPAPMPDATPTPDASPTPDMSDEPATGTDDAPPAPQR